VAVDVEVVTGKILHTLDSASMGSPCPVIGVISIDNNGGTPQQAEKQKFVRITASTSQKQSTYDALTEADRTLPATVVAVDPHSDLVFPLGRVSDRNSQRFEPFGVLDTLTGQPRRPSLKMQTVASLAVRMGGA
jgi:chemotaxis response regulator CheB